jgi:hypothetical protein
MFCKPKRKVGGKSGAVALDLLVQTPGAHAVEACEFGVEQDPLAAH